MTAPHAGDPAGDTPSVVEISEGVRPLVTSSMPVDDIDDVMQEVQAAALRTFAPGSGLYADRGASERTRIVVGIARHKCADAHQKRVQQRLLEERCLPDLPTTPDQYAPVGGAPLEVRDELQRWADLVRGPLDDLSDDEHKALVHRYAYDLSYRTMAEVLDVPFNTLRDRAERALKKVRAAANLT